MKIKPLAAALLALGISAQVLADEVKYYDRAPSVEELQKQLMGTSEPAKPRTRAIVFGDDPPAAAREAEPAAPRPAQVRVESRSEHAPAGTASAPVRPAAADRAIAFPINFNINSAQILPDAIPFLESVAGLMQQDRSIRLLIEGHTDSTGSASRNLVLSRERANAVKDYLTDYFGIDPARFIAVGKGSSETLNGLPASHPRNRRVQFRIAG